MNALLQPIDFGPFHEFEDEDASPRIGLDHLGHSHPLIGREVRSDHSRVPRLLPKIYLLFNSLRELAHDRRDRTDVVIWKENVHEEENAERGIQVGRDELLDARSQDLHDDVAVIDSRAMYLAQRRRRQRLGIEPRKELVRRTPILAQDEGL